MIRAALLAAVLWLWMAAGASASIPLLGAGSFGVPAPTYIETVADTESSSSSSTPTWSASPASGQLLLACCIGNYGDAISPPGSPTWTQDYNNTSQYGVGCWHRIAGASEPTTNTFTITNGPVHINCIAARFSGATSSAPQITALLNSTGTAANTTAITPSATNSIPYVFFLGASNPTSYTTPSGYTLEGTYLAGGNAYGGIVALGPVITTITSQNPSSTSGGSAVNYGLLYVVNHP
jgi:hypothetical protein